MGFEYLRSGAGILNIIEEVFNLIGFCVIAASDWKTDEGKAFMACGIIGFIITGILMTLQTFGIHERIHINWSLTQVIYCGCLAVFYLVASSFVFDAFNIAMGGIHISATRPDEYTAAGSIGVIATVLYIIEGVYRIVLKV